MFGVGVSSRGWVLDCRVCGHGGGESCCWPLLRLRSSLRLTLSARWDGQVLWMERLRRSLFPVSL